MSGTAPSKVSLRTVIADEPGTVDRVGRSN